jgi:hypothetical protein
MKTKMTSAIVFIVTLISLANCTEEEILPTNGKSTKTTSDWVQPGPNEEIVYNY